ncbi:MAG TPA: DUF6249 domain-containing protein [Mucilaginibacter sp.]|nr:DUF6249 domain-containing protein [Mucilaginibacter sp.]
MKTTSAALFISVSLVVFGICYYYFTTRHKERMAIIEKGLPPDFFRGLNNYLPLVLTLGMICIGVAIGITLGCFLWELLPLEPVFTIAASVFLFSGISMVISYFIVKRISK